MKHTLIFTSIFILLIIGFPYSAQAISIDELKKQLGQDDESQCKKLSKDHTKYGSPVDPIKYQKCLDHKKSEQFWRDVPRWGVGIFILIVIVGILIIVAKNLKTGAYNSQYSNTSDYSYTPVVRRGWTVEEKEKVRIRQDGKCAHCGKPPPRWEYHHINGDRSDNSLDNCEGLCPNCHSVETHGG